MIFPFETDLEETKQEDVPLVPREYGIDFSTGQLTGQIVTGRNAVMCWIWMALQTQRYRHLIYSWDYGQEYEDLIGKGYSRAYMESEIESMTEEALLVNPYITGLEDFTCEAAGDVVTASFTVTTKFGEVNIDVRGDELRIDHG
jgi:hypothetical protein